MLKLVAVEGKEKLMLSTNRTIRIGLTVFLCLVLVLGLVPVEKAHADTATNNIRIDGSDRYGTSFAVAETLLEQMVTFDSVVVASGKDYPDALSGGYLAKVKNAPVLLVESKNESTVLSYIRSHMRYGGKVYILGGEGAVSKKFENSLKTAGLSYKRLAGNNRYGTNIEILKEAGYNSSRVFICSGKGYADALSAAAIGAPILLVNGSLTREQQDYLRELNPAKIYVVGGTSAVNSSIMSTASNIASTVRVGGSDRYETSANIADTFFLGTRKNVVITSGKNYPDALSAAPLAMRLNAPILLVGETNKASLVSTFIYTKDTSTCYVVGGPKAISDSIVKSATSLLGSVTLTNAPGTAGAMISVMRSWLGYSEANGRYKQIVDIYNSVQPWPRGYKYPYGAAWCDVTVSAAGIVSGCESLIGRECGVGYHVDIFIDKGIWRPSTPTNPYKPKAGDIIVYNWYPSNPRISSHIGVVEEVRSIGNGKYQIVAIEGNKSEKVDRRVIDWDSKYIKGYGTPRYKVVSVSTSTGTAVDIVSSVVNG